MPAGLFARRQWTYPNIHGIGFLKSPWHRRMRSFRKRDKFRQDDYPDGFYDVVREIEYHKRRLDAVFDACAENESPLKQRETSTKGQVQRDESALDHDDIDISYLDDDGWDPLLRDDCMRASLLPETVRQRTAKERVARRKWLELRARADRAASEDVESVNAESGFGARGTGADTLGFEFDPISGRMVPKRDTLDDEVVESKEATSIADEDVASKDSLSTEIPDQSSSSNKDSMSTAESAKTSATQETTSKVPDEKNPDGASPKKDDNRVNEMRIKASLHTSVPSYQETDGAPNPEVKQAFNEFVQTMAGDGSGKAKSAQTSNAPEPQKSETPGVIMGEPPEPEADNAPEKSKNTSEVPQRAHDGTVEFTPTPNPETSVPFETEPKTERKMFLDQQTENPAKAEDNDLDFLTASDIRANYDSKKLDQESDTERQQRRQAMQDELDAYSDPASHLDAQEIRERFLPATGDSSLERGLRGEIDHIPPKEHRDMANAKLSPDMRKALEEDADIEQGSPGDVDYVPPRESPTQETMAKPPALYRILAYDSSSLQVTRAETSSSQFSQDGILHPTEVLPRLNNPAKFLPYFSEMQNEGYEIVSGGGDILVFKKVRDAAPDAYIPGDAKEAPKKESRKVTRQETVYTGGPPNWSPYPPPPRQESPPTEEIPPKSNRGKTWRKMLLAGSVTAATCYALGVVSEYFRTGGQEGRGIDGFTEFESARRRRE